LPPGVKAEQRHFRQIPFERLAIVQSGKASVPGTAWRSSRETTSGADSIKPAGNPQDRQARYIEAAVNGILIASIYLPNGNPQPGRSSITNWPGSSV